MKATRTTLASIPKYAARPPATPASFLSVVERVTRGGVEVMTAMVRRAGAAHHRGWPASASGMSLTPAVRAAPGRVGTHDARAGSHRHGRPAHGGDHRQRVPEGLGVRVRHRVGRGPGLR